MADSQTTKCASCEHWRGDCTLGAPNPSPVKPAPMPFVLWCGGYQEQPNA